MNTLAQVEIGFYQENQAYVTLTTKPSDFRREFQEVLIFCAYTLKQIYNIDPDQPICKLLVRTLRDLKPEKVGCALAFTVAPARPSLLKRGGLKAVSISIKDIELVDYYQPADKRFFAHLEREGAKVQFSIQAHGFGMLGKGINYYVPMSIGILLNYLALVHKDDFNLVSAFYFSAHTCGEMAAEKRIDRYNQMDLAIEIARTIFKHETPNAVSRDIHREMKQIIGEVINTIASSTTYEVSQGIFSQDLGEAKTTFEASKKRLLGAQERLEKIYDFWPDGTIFVQKFKDLIEVYIRMFENDLKSRYYLSAAQTNEPDEAEYIRINKQFYDKRHSLAELGEKLTAEVKEILMAATKLDFDELWDHYSQVKANSQ